MNSTTNPGGARPDGMPSKSKHRPLRVAVLAGVVLACLVGSGVALAAPGGWSPWVKADNGPADFDSSFCGFPIHVGIVLNQQYSREMTLADGTWIQQIKGLAVESLTNTDTKKSIPEYEVGPVSTTIYPDGSGLVVADGHHGFYFVPADQAAVGEPGLAYATGHVVETWAPNNGVLTSFNLSGRQTNICDVLR
jgi:hypothetical protein